MEENMNKKKSMLKGIMTFVILMLAIIFVRVNVQAAGVTVSVKSTKIALNSSINTVTKKLGKYNAVYTEPSGLRAYVYASTKNRFVIAYTDGTKVVGLYTLSSKFAFGNVSSGYTTSNLKSKGFKADTFCSVQNEQTRLSKYYGYLKEGNSVSTRAYIDYWGSKKVYAAKIYLNKYSYCFNNYGIYTDNSNVRKGVEKEAFYVTNAFRAYKGLSVLKSSSVTTSVARAHSTDMAKNNYFSHTGLDGRSPFDRMTDAKIKWWIAGENIAAGQNCGTNFVMAWIGSKGHRSNVLHKYFTNLGIGYAYSSKNTYGSFLTQNFFGRR